MAQEPPAMQLKDDPPPVDRLADAAQVSALRLVVGVTLDDPLREVAAPTAGFLADIPQGWGAVCLRLISRDALYEGRADFEVSDIPEAGARMAVPSFISPDNWSKILDRYGGRLMPALTAGPCDGASQKHALAYRPGADASDKGTVHIAVNAQGAQETFAVVTSAGRTWEIDCPPAGEAGGVGFDRLCKLRVSELQLGQPAEITINRLTDGQYAEPQGIVLLTVPRP